MYYIDSISSKDWSNEETIFVLFITVNFKRNYEFVLLMYLGMLFLQFVKWLYNIDDDNFVIIINFVEKLY